MRAKDSEGNQELGDVGGNRRIAQKLMMQPTGSKGQGGRNSRQRDPNRFNLYFQQESRQDLERMKLDGLKPYTKADPIQREVDFRYFKDYSFPIRPNWHYTMNKEHLERNENKYFRVCERIRKCNG